MVVEEIVSFLGQLISQPAIFLGLITLTGLALLRRPIEEIVGESLKTAIGLLILLGGVQLMVQGLNPIMTVMAKLMGQPGAPVKLGTAVVIQELGIAVGLVMVFAFIINLVLARFTPLRYIYLTGHLIFWNAVIYTAIFKYVGGFEGPLLVAVSSIFVGLYQAISSWYNAKFSRIVNGEENFVLGHSSSLAVLLTALVTTKFGRQYEKPKNVRDFETLTFPEKLSWLREPMLLMAAVFIVLYVIITSIGTTYMAELATKEGIPNVGIYALVKALTFAAGFAVLMIGVRMLIGSLVPAFEGIAKKVVIGAVPALDCPLFFPYGPSSMAFGGIIGCLGMMIGTLIGLLTGYTWYIFAPTMSAWFHGATAAVYGNKFAGMRGAIFGALLAGLLMAGGQALMWPLIGFAIGDFFTWASDTDYVVIGGILAYVLKLFR